jgi:toxin CcdB
MAQFDIVANPNTRERQTRPFLAILQDDRFAPMTTVVVAPFAKISPRQSAGDLTPSIDIGGESFALIVPELGAVRARLLGPAIGRCVESRYAILRALDLLFTGV